MKTLAIHPNQWRDFCEAFTQLNKGTGINIELIRFDNHRDVVASGEILQRMTLDTGDACNNMISITLGVEGGRRIHHVVIEPIHLRIKENGGGHKLLQIEAENGVTLVDFRSGKLPSLQFESEFASLGNASENKSERNMDIPS
jgi:hypothetical protein